MFYYISEDHRIWKYWLSSIKVTPWRHIIYSEKALLQQDSVNEVKIPEQPIYKILLVDQNREYEDLRDDMAEERNEDEFEESDDCSDDLSDDSDDKEISICHII